MLREEDELVNDSELEAIETEGKVIDLMAALIKSLKKRQALSSEPPAVAYTETDNG